MKLRRQETDTRWQNIKKQIPLTSWEKIGKNSVTQIKSRKKAAVTDESIEKDECEEKR